MSALLDGCLACGFESGIKLPHSKKLCAKEGYDPVYGARPKRFIQQRLETPLSRKIIAGDIAKGSSVEVSVKNGVLVFGYRA